MKKLIYLSMFIGSCAGSYLPTAWGASVFSGQSLILGFVGAIVGILGGFQLAQSLGME
jgi:uncharacterized membrane protein